MTFDIRIRATYSEALVETIRKALKGVEVAALRFDSSTVDRAAFSEASLRLREGLALHINNALDHNVDFDALVAQLHAATARDRGPKILAESCAADLAGHRADFLAVDDPHAPPADPLSVLVDGVSLGTLLERDRLMRQGQADHPALHLWPPFTPAQRSAMSAHWSAELRAKRGGR